MHILLLIGDYCVYFHDFSEIFKKSPVPPLDIFDLRKLHVIYLPVVVNAGVVVSACVCASLPGELLVWCKGGDGVALNQRISALNSVLRPE